ncbi:MAG: hormogonium polysaccharide biosynthesis protein HpsA [Aphanizomenon sp.]
MSKKGQALNKNISIVRRFIQQFLATIKRQIIGLLRTVFVTRKHQRAGNAGFVLPTVTMVSVVVVLLTTAIMFRSFDRAKNASNVRVNQMVMNSAAPAIDRAKAKLNKLFKDQRLSRATPTERELDNVLVDKISEYTFGDERNLIVCYDPSSGLNRGICSANTLNLETAWQFPIDTDNNGKFDSYTLYGIYYKNPALSGTSFVKRNPVQARAIPMTITSAGGNCPSTAISASLAGVNGWFKDNKSLNLVKGFFVYTVTVPITSTENLPNNPPYEKASNSKGFSALGYEQDKIKRSLLNNAVIYQDDLYLTAEDADFKLNGGIFTNGNLLAGSTSGKSIKIYQVSSPNSCFYEADNAKITVGGNIATVGASGSTKFDLFPGKGVIPTQAQAISLSGNESVTDATTDVAYNNSDYVQRVNSLVAAQKANSADSDPSEVKKGIERIKAAIGLSSYTSDQIDKIRSEQLTLYFQKRTRRVPVKDTDGTTSPLQGTGDSLRPKDAWIYPTDPNNGKTGTGYTGLTLKTAGNTLLPAATEPSLLLKNGKEQLLGDRIRVGNNLPQLWWKTSQFVGPDPGDIQNITDIKWGDSNNPSTQDRYRFSRIQNLADAGSTDRDRDWELAAAKVPDNPQDPVGGLRVITGAGIYLRTGDTAATTDFTTPIPGFTVPASTTIYDGALPEPPDNTSPPDANTPYLKMRASAVYHYKQAGYSQTAPKPIACVSSFYYDDSESTTKNKKNQSGLPPWTLPLPVGFDVGDTDPNGLSNNGIVYGPPTKIVSDYQAVLNYQSTLKYDNGRSIDDGLLAGALAATAANQTLTLSQKSTIDAAICALQILDGSISPTNTVIPHGAIFEVKVKDNESLTVSSTVLDLGQLKGKTIGSATPSQEYLIPNSGIIYATRDDALADKTSINTNFTPRLNAIILTNGSDISRELNYRDAEKGLIVATNLPLYIKGDFNLHTKEEFNTSLNDSWDNFYTRSDRNPNFACRPNDPKLKINGVDSCPTGDKWRSAAVISDSITLLSNNYDATNTGTTAADTTYNAILVSGNTGNCSLEDYVRFPEDWTEKKANISGIFMQQKKSIYDTSCPPNPTPPTRNWSYDVGILRQSPDLLAQKLIADISDPPNEYFREVDRDDPWIQNLLCAKDNTNPTNPNKPYIIIDEKQRPSMCQS